MRFLKRVGQPEGPFGCRRFYRENGVPYEDRYGQFRGILFGKVETEAHRVAWILANNRPVSAGLEIVHSCDHVWCVEELHLTSDTHAENMKQMVERSRVAKGDRNGTRLHPETRPCHVGENNPNAILLIGDVIKIKRQLAAGESRARLARDFKVSWNTINDIYQDLTWRNVSC